MMGKWMARKGQIKAIEFRGVSFGYGKQEILSEFDFEMKQDEKVVVFGKSGTGKSTMLRLLLGFERVEEGSVWVLGKKMSVENVGWIRSKLAYVDQDVMMGEGRVKELIEEYFDFRVNRKVGLDERELKTEMDNLGLDEGLLEKGVSQLSGGERQRVAIVVAKLLKRPILVLDEVTSALDAGSKELVIDQVIGNREQSVLVVTHDREWREARGVKVYDFREKKWVQ